MATINDKNKNMAKSLLTVWEVLYLLWIRCEYYCCCRWLLRSQKTHRPQIEAMDHDDEMDIGV